MKISIKEKKKRKKKQALNYGIVSKEFDKVIKFNQNTWLRPYIDTNIDLRKKMKNDFEKHFFKLMNNVVFGKTMENVRKNRNIKLVATERRRNYLVSELNFYIEKFFIEKLLAIEMNKTEILINKLVYLAFSILKFSKILNV